MSEELNTQQAPNKFKKFRLLGSVITYGIMVYGGLNLINTMLLPTEYKQLGNLGFEKMVSLYQRFQGKEAQKQGSELVFNRAVEEKLKSDRAKAMQIQKNIESLEKGSVKKPPTKNPFGETTPTQSPKNLNDNPFDSAVNRIEQQVHQKNSLKATINQCIAMGNNYNELRSCLTTNIKDPKILDPLLQKVQKFEQEANAHSRSFNHLRNIRFAANDNDFRNYAILTKQEMRSTNHASRLTSNNDYKNHVVLAYTVEEVEAASGPVNKCYFFSSSYVEARKCVRQNVKDPKLARDLIEVVEAALTCGSWKFEEPRSYFACLRRNIKDPKLADITIEGVKNEMKEQLDDL